MANTNLVKTYDPKGLIITHLGIPVNDFIDGTFISIVRDPSFEVKKGADGSENRINLNSWNL